MGLGRIRHLEPELSDVDGAAGEHAAVGHGVADVDRTYRKEERAGARRIDRFPRTPTAGFPEGLNLEKDAVAGLGEGGVHDRRPGLLIVLILEQHPAADVLLEDAQDRRLAGIVSNRRLRRSKFAGVDGVHEAADHEHDDDQDQEAGQSEGGEVGHDGS